MRKFSSFLLTEAKVPSGWIFEKIENPLELHENLRTDWNNGKGEYYMSKKEFALYFTSPIVIKKIFDRKAESEKIAYVGASSLSDSDIEKCLNFLGLRRTFNISEAKNIFYSDAYSKFNEHGVLVRGCSIYKWSRYPGELDFFLHKINYKDFESNSKHIKALESKLKELFPSYPTNTTFLDRYNYFIKRRESQGIEDIENSYKTEYVGTFYLLSDPSINLSNIQKIEDTALAYDIDVLNIILEEIKSAEKTELEPELAEHLESFVSAVWDSANAELVKSILSSVNTKNAIIPIVKAFIKLAEKDNFNSIANWKKTLEMTILEFKDLEVSKPFYGGPSTKFSFYYSVNKWLLRNSIERSELLPILKQKTSDLID